MKRKYLFIVGMPRTGTKLIGNILRNSQHVPFKISPENFFMGHLIKGGIRHEIKKMGDMSDDANIRKLVDEMYAGRFPGTYWIQLRSGYLGVNKEQFLQKLLSSDRTPKGIYEAMMMVHPEITDQTILGDKNPGHLYHVSDLLEWFPEAKVIHTFRDPRAILVSEWRRKMGYLPPTLLSELIKPFFSVFIVVHVTITWLYAVRLHYKYKNLYPKNYYLSRFEDLVTKPEESIKKICEFLEIEPDPELLSPRKFGSSFASDEGVGFDEQTLTRWQDHLKPWMNAWLLFWTKKHLKGFGYL